MWNLIIEYPLVDDIGFIDDDLQSLLDKEYSASGCFLMSSPKIRDLQYDYEDFDSAEDACGKANEFLQSKFGEDMYIDFVVCKIEGEEE